MTIIMNQSLRISMSILMIAASALSNTNASTIESFAADCDFDAYYNGVDIYDRDALHALTKSKHRHVLPYTSNSQWDVWDALIDLDGIDSDGGNGRLVHLVYRDADVTAEEYGTADTWNREHVWPKSRGVGDNGPDYTDVFALRPSDWSVNAARGKKLFGECGLVHTMSECKVPAHVEAAADTAADPSIWLPPKDVRGDLARSLMYMAIRYDGESDDDSDRLDLELSDCPDSPPAGDSSSLMGYLSILLKWHQEDIVDLKERQRNENVCKRWQGNRNPFVDYPELVDYYFGAESGYSGYNCDNDGESNDGSSSNNDQCAGLVPGDLMISGFKSDNPDLVSIVALVDIDDTATLYMTDNAYTGTALRSNEGVVKLELSSAIKAGSIISFGIDDKQHSSMWVQVSGTFALSTSGDNIFVYCKNELGENFFLTGLTYTPGGWVQKSSIDTTFTTNESALPDELIVLATALPHFDNYIYNGTKIGTKANLIAALADAENWYGSNDSADVTLSMESFTVEDFDEISGAFFSLADGTTIK